MSQLPSHTHPPRWLWSQISRAELQDSSTMSWEFNTGTNHPTPHKSCFPSLPWDRKKDFFPEGHARRVREGALWRRLAWSEAEKWGKALFCFCHTSAGNEFDIYLSSHPHFWNTMKRLHQTWLFNNIYWVLPHSYLFTTRWSHLWHFLKPHLHYADTLTDTKMAPLHTLYSRLWVLWLLSNTWKKDN